MHPVVLLALAVGVPFGCLGMLLLLGWLEDSLDAETKKSERRRAPAPIRTVPTPTGPAAVSPAAMARSSAPAAGAQPPA